jgi:DNA-binding Lrp family transcriptional regulator
MVADVLKESATIDEIDRAIIHCLQIDGRVPFRRIAEALAISEQTVARRYGRLRADGVVRVVGLVYPASYGQASWLLRIQARPESVRALADALAERDDVAWVTIDAGGAHISAALHVRSSDQRDELLLQRLPRHTQVLSLTMHSIMHRFIPSSGVDWSLQSSLISGAADRMLASGRLPLKHQGLQPPEKSDAPLLAALAVDGRATVASLADACGWTQARTGRRVNALLSAGTVYLDVDISLETLGFTNTAEIWLTIEPRHLQVVGQELADLPEVAFVAAVTGNVNVMAFALFRRPDELYTFLTERVGSLPGVRQAEVSPVLQQIKQAGSWVEGTRLRGMPVRGR